MMMFSSPEIQAVFKFMLLFSLTCSLFTVFFSPTLVRNLNLLHMRVLSVGGESSVMYAKVPVLTVQLVRPRSALLSHALQGVLHHLAGRAGSLRGSINRQWPRGERRARQRVSVGGEISAGGAAREVEYRPLLKHAKTVERGDGFASAPGRRVRLSSCTGAGLARARRAAGV